ncbi:Techylectin-5B [Armadillidium nasatum]|uniref:Techylectin-5B n=1 Tax=Armadillidium nasatum TaxID=96803 RepID=A0A5N5STT7_9CRUS|nr:Techylectin-5B [Armadillidium nasatum]
MDFLFLFLLFISTYFKCVNSIGSESIISGLGNIFQAIGFSPQCVAESLALCERSLVSNGTRNANTPGLRDTESVLQPLENLVNRPRNCADLYKSGDQQSGVRIIYPFSCCIHRFVSVFCDQSTGGGGWTVIQRRKDTEVRENFFRKWNEYKQGFGNLSSEFWLGLDNIHALVDDQLMEMRIDLEDFEGEKRYAKYSYFDISDESDKYRLDIGEYSGSAGDGFKNRHVGFPFSTKDKDNDSHKEHCASLYKGGWWYDQCHISNLNGYQHKGAHSSYADGINWHPFHGYHYSLKETSMSLRPQNFK